MFQYNLQYIGFNDNPGFVYGFDLKRIYKVVGTSKVGRWFRFCRTSIEGSLMIYSKLIWERENQFVRWPFFSTSEDIECWNVLKGAYFEVVARIFDFYKRFDDFCYVFPEFEKIDEDLILPIKEEEVDYRIEDLKFPGCTESKMRKKEEIKRKKEKELKKEKEILKEEKDKLFLKKRKKEKKKKESILMK
jgi:hypothetical protein